MSREKNYQKLVKVSNFCGKNYTEYESKNSRNKTLSVEEYLNKISQCLTDNK